MVAFALLFFLLLVSIMTAVLIMVALKAVDFVDTTYRFYREMERIEGKMDEILRALNGAGGPPRKE